MFLSLSMCFTVNAKVVIATKDPTCPRESRRNECDDYWSNEKGTDFKTCYYQHDQTQIFADEEKRRKDNIATATQIAVPATISAILLASGVGSPAVAIIGGGGIAGAGTALGNLFFKTMITNGEKWLQSSTVHDHCGVKVHYWQDIFGIWHYYGFEPQ
ncbi:MAG: hypothetical protein V8P98_05740 [Acutalibacteraceae bacterium]